ncbi:MAG: dTMP kinase [bacterium]|nr:dTMP kinase [bacterium]MCP4966373.1 dTMP kinase [bacterium]
MTGHYIAFEGIEGTGKSTLAGLLTAHLEAMGKDVLRVREPGGTETGERIRGVLLDPGGSVSPWSEALLFAAARAQLAHELVGPALESGSWVVTDRSVYSSLAYQGAGRGLGVAEVRAVNEPGLGDVWPELVVLLTVDAATGLVRQEDADRIGAEGVAFQTTVGDTFEELALADPDRFVVVDASPDLDTVWKQVLQHVEGRWVISSEM